MKLATAAIMAVALFGATSASAGVNLVTNGDFETPIGDINNPGFGTDYQHGSLAPQGMISEGTWVVGTNPNAVHPAWINIQDTNNMLILNGKTEDLPSDAWWQDINVAAGNYNFAFDAMNICCNGSYGGPNLPSVLTLAFSTDGGANFTALDTITTTPPGDAGIWQNRSGQFSVGAGVLRVAVRNDLGGFGGNDFAVDNISITAVPEPATWAMMIMGFGAAGAMLRRRRQLVVA